MQQKTKIILITVIVFLLVVFLTTFFVVKYNNNKKKQLLNQQQIEVKENIQNNPIESVTAPESANGTLPVVDQKVIDSLTAPRPEESTRKKPAPAVDQKTIDSLSGPAK